MRWGQNTTYLQYTLLEGPSAVQLTLRHPRPIATTTARRQPMGRAGAPRSGPDGVLVAAHGSGATPWRLVPGCGRPRRAAAAWDAPIFRRVEAERGLAALDQRLRLGELACRSQPARRGPHRVGRAARAVERDACRGARGRAAAAARNWWPRRGCKMPTDGCSSWPSPRISSSSSAACDGGRRCARPHVIAGYPWFGDWGRDTMISLPGLCLATRRYDIAPQHPANICALCVRGHAAQPLSR